MNKKWILPTIYILFLMLPIYGLLSMSFKTTNEILGGFSFFPQQFTLANYSKIFTDPTWYVGYINSLIYVVINTVISVAVALPAAYAFSRYRFLGDKHLFFWLLTNRMAPPAVFALPFFQLYSAIELFDTHLAVALAHCLFNIPLAVWISMKPPTSMVIPSGDFSCEFLSPPLPPASVSQCFSVSCIPGWSCCWQKP
jgi:glycerol transport system permease protein